MDTYGKIIVNFRPLTHDSPPFFSFPCPRRRRAAPSTPPCTRGSPLKTPPPAADRRRPSGVHLHHRRKLRERKSDVEFGGCPSSRRREVRGGRSVGRAGRRLFVRTEVEGLGVCEEKGTQIGGSGPRGTSGGEG